MSASNWRTCPQCRANAAAAKAAKQKAADEAYGKVPLATYHHMLAEVASVPALEHTLREDWEIGTTDAGEFYVAYWANCDECRFQHSYEHRALVPINHQPVGG